MGINTEDALGYALTRDCRYWNVHHLHIADKVCRIQVNGFLDENTGQDRTLGKAMLVSYLKNKYAHFIYIC